jgi:hypothetical protein
MPDPAGLGAGEQEAGAVTVEAADSRVTIGDCWDALDAASVQPNGLGTGSAFFTLPEGSYLKMPNRAFVDGGEASNETLAALASLGVQPTASGSYPVPPGVGPGFAAMRWGWVRESPATA